MSTNTKKSNTHGPKTPVKRKIAKKKSIKRKSGVLSSSLTVDTGYARIALLLLALNLLFIGYVVAKLSV